MEKQCELQITLIEASERILKNLPESISEKVNSILRKRGVKVLENSNVTKVSEKGLSLSTGEIIPAELVVWAAGIKCASFLSSIGLETNELNQIITNTKLQSIDEKISIRLVIVVASPGLKGLCRLFRPELKQPVSKLSIYPINLKVSLMVKKVNLGDTLISVRRFPQEDSVQVEV